MSLMQRLSRRAKTRPSRRRYSQEVLAEIAYLDARAFGWDVRDRYYPYDANDWRAKREHLLATTTPTDPTARAMIVAS